MHSIFMHISVSLSGILAVQAFSPQPCHLDPLSYLNKLNIVRICKAENTQTPTTHISSSFIEDNSGVRHDKTKFES